MNDSLNKNSYKFIFNKSKITLQEQYSHHRLVLLEWMKNDGDFINKGDLLLNFGYRTSYINDNIIPHFASETGFLSIIKKNANKYSELRDDEWLYSLHPNDNDWINDHYINEPEIVADDFIGNKIIKWKQVGMMSGYAQGVTTLSIDRQNTLILSFNYLDAKDYLTLNFYKKEFMLHPGDSISFIFENNQVLSFPITANSYKNSHPFISGLYENRLIITDDELLLFSSCNLVKWKLILKKQGRDIIGGEAGQFNYLESRQLVEVLKKLSKEYRAIVRNEIEGYQPLLTREEIVNTSLISEVEPCYVYLMHDVINDFYKIGISNQPEWREKTLQSEKPTIKLIVAKKFINRKIASAFEKALHFTYAEKRIRGEWFQLDHTDLDEIVVTLSN